MFLQRLKKNRKYEYLLLGIFTFSSFKAIRTTSKPYSLVANATKKLEIQRNKNKTIMQCIDLNVKQKRKTAAKLIVSTTLKLKNTNLLWHSRFSKEKWLTPSPPTNNPTPKIAATQIINHIEIELTV
ncbi:MAG: hypothetical protein CFE24_12390 [Flavobacterium sp. BFFFF2]|nr:MAG: hypothetical protein CFE24_12390 [Flavobacterium sp. BFFFF2]